MCTECEGIGRTVQLDLEKFLDRSLSINGGAFLHPEFRVGKWFWKTYVLSGLFDNDKPIRDYTSDELHSLLYGSDIRVEFGEFGKLQYEGLIERFTRAYIKKDAAAMSDRHRAVFDQFTTAQTCPSCHGGRLNPAALNSRIAGRNIAELSDMEITELVAFLGTLTDPLAIRIASKLNERLQHLVDIGLGYLTLSRVTTTLSGGESQRIKMIRHLGSSLTDMLYILDEPSVGLHARDVSRLNDLLCKLRDKGNTVLVVEHDPDVIAAADYVVDIGPRAGTHGGEVVFHGSYAALQRADTLTGRALSQHLPIKTIVRTPHAALPIRVAALHNLRDITVDIPTGVLTVVTGVAGAGKSTLINDVFLAQHPDAIMIDQSRVSANSRSAPATYTGIMDEIRAAFAKANGVKPALFSFNSEGSCPTCSGLGLVYTEVAYLEPVASVCEICEGKRFRPDVLAYKLRGSSIADVLEMTAEEALAFFTEKKIQPILRVC
jgi:excinuclease ABC A subunit